MGLEHWQQRNCQQHKHIITKEVGACTNYWMNTVHNQYNKHHTNLMEINQKLQKQLITTDQHITNLIQQQSEADQAKIQELNKQLSQILTAQTIKNQITSFQQQIQYIYDTQQQNVIKVKKIQELGQFNKKLDQLFEQVYTKRNEVMQYQKDYQTNTQNLDQLRKLIEQIDIKIQKTETETHEMASQIKLQKQKLQNK